MPQTAECALTMTYTRTTAWTSARELVGLQHSNNGTKRQLCVLAESNLSPDCHGRESLDFILDQQACL